MSLRISEQRQAEIHAKIRPAVTVLRQFTGKPSVAASQIQNGLIPLQSFHHPPYSRLDTLTCGRERIAETGVKLTVEFDKAGGGGWIHQEDYTQWWSLIAFFQGRRER